MQNTHSPYVTLRDLDQRMDAYERLPLTTSLARDNWRALATTILCFVAWQCLAFVPSARQDDPLFSLGGFADVLPRTFNTVLDWLFLVPRDYVLTFMVAAIPLNVLVQILSVRATHQSPLWLHVLALAGSASGVISLAVTAFAGIALLVTAAAPFVCWGIVITGGLAFILALALPPQRSNASRDRNRRDWNNR